MHGRDTPDIVGNNISNCGGTFSASVPHPEISDMASVNELLAQKAAIEQQIAEAQRAERAGAVAKVRALMAEHGLTVADLSTKLTAAKRSGAKVAAKYRNAETGDTWSGRGLQPKWLKQALASGKKISDFAI
jgi:DNA-binding protein H-NS